MKSHLIAVLNLVKISDNLDYKLRSHKETKVRKIKTGKSNVNNTVAMVFSLQTSISDSNMVVFMTL